MSSRDTVRDSPRSKTSEGGSSDDGAAAADAPKEVNADGEKTFDLYRFQANTVPPGLREEILASKPPPVPEGRFEDTVPPNVVIGDRIDPMPVVRPSARPSSLTWIVGAGAAILAFALIVLLAAPKGQDESRNAATPRAVESPESPTPPSASIRRPASGTSTPVSQPPKATESKRNFEPPIVRATASEKPKQPTVSVPEPTPPASTRSGAFATPLAPPDK